MSLAERPEPVHTAALCTERRDPSDNSAVSAEPPRRSNSGRSPSMHACRPSGPFLFQCALKAYPLCDHSSGYRGVPVSLLQDAATWTNCKQRSNDRSMSNVHAGELTKCGDERSMEAGREIAEKPQKNTFVGAVSKGGSYMSPIVDCVCVLL